MKNHINKIPLLSLEEANSVILHCLPQAYEEYYDQNPNHQLSLSPTEEICLHYQIVEKIIDSTFKHECYDLQFSLIQLYQKEKLNLLRKIELEQTIFESYHSLMNTLEELVFRVSQLMDESIQAHPKLIIFWINFLGMENLLDYLPKRKDMMTDRNQYYEHLIYRAYNLVEMLQTMRKEKINVQLTINN